MAELMRYAYEEAPAPEPGLAEVLSPSQVRTFADCQARWWFKYGVGMADPPTPSLGFGRALHVALETAMRHKKIAGRDLAAPEVIEVFGAVWRDEADQVAWSEDEGPEDLAMKGFALLELFMRDRAPSIQPAAVELDVAGEIGGVAVRGRLDVLEVDGTIVDFKTAGRKPGAHLTMDQAFQAATYAMLEPRASGLVRIETLIKTKEPKLATVESQLGEADYRQPQQVYPLAQAAMRSGYYMPNRASMMCSRKQCPFWSACEDEFGGRVAGQEGA